MKKTLVLLMIFAFLLSGCLNTNNPTTLPSTAPTALPTSAPTTVPGTEPTVDPGTEPTADPGTEPTIDPGSEPSTAPGIEPTTEPSTEPTTEPTTEPPHEHSYSAHVVKPTCTESGYTEYTCACGDTYTDNEAEAHGHDYYVGKTVEATCTDRGYNVYICDYCGDTYHWDYTTAKGHDYGYEVIDPTTDSQGYTLYTCKVCEHSYQDNFIEKLPACEHEYTCTSVDGTCLEEGHYLYECVHCGHTYKESNGMGWAEHNFDLVDYKDPTPEEDGYAVLECTWCEKQMTNVVEYEPEIYEVPDAGEVAQAVVKYINQFRAEQGDTQLTMLPGMTQVAEYRSVQISTNYAHDVTEIREAHAYYQYGRYVDLSEYGGDPSQNYYTSGAGEAIGRSGVGQKTADEAGKIIAEQFKASSSHWEYVGSSKNSYIGVGCYYWGGEWFTCVMVGPTNYG